MTRDDRAAFADLLRAAVRAAKGDAAVWTRFVEALPEPVRRRIHAEFFEWQAHGAQNEPPGDWRVWLLRAGRGFGKTRTGAEWVLARARETPAARIALVAASREEAARVMVGSEGGLLAAARSDEEMVWVPTRGVVEFESGAQAFVYSAAAPEQLRGPEHHFAWCDELAKWKHADAAWDNLQMGMRLGTRPRLVVTTTPKTVPILARVRGLAGTVETVGRTAENLHSAAEYRRWLAETYGGTRLGRQELDGELFTDVEGALWTRAMLEAARVRSGAGSGDSIDFLGGSGAEGRAGAGKCMLSPFIRIVVGVDPPASAEGDACGIVVAGLGADGIAYVLADCSVAGMRPEGWARAVARAAEAWGADRVVAEKNQGGDMVESVLRGIDAAMPVKLVSASRGKAARAEPIAARFEAGKARLAGAFPALEDELAGIVAGGGYTGPGRSPDRADAMVWAITELIRPAARPGLRAL